MLFAVFLLPWWVILILVVIFSIMFKNPVELFFYLFIYYLMFGLPGQSNHVIKMLTLLAFIVSILTIISVQNRMRARSIKEVYYKD